MIRADGITVGYGKRNIVEQLSLDIPKGKITTIIGPNGCGKSTLLKSVSRMINVQRGSIHLDGKLLHDMDTREIARQMAVLPQTAEAPSGLTVFELISYGRFPHHKGFSSLTRQDFEAIYWSISVAGLEELKDAQLNELSGGQRQRVWIAMALAQGTDLLVLDEPTTYLDMAHQLEILVLLQRLNEEQGRTIVMVLHDLNHAARFSHYMVAMKHGEVITHGPPEAVMTKENLKQLFQIDASISACPFSGKPICQAYQLC